MRRPRKRQASPNPPIYTIRNEYWLVVIVSASVHSNAIECNVEAVAPELIWKLWV